MMSRNRKIFSVSSLVLNLFGSQIGEFFLPHPLVALSYLPIATIFASFVEVRLQ